MAKRNSITKAGGLLAQPMPLRALLEFTSLPDHHRTFRLTNDDCGSHIKEGEYAVVDLSDQQLQHGELYLIQYESGERRRRIVQIKTTMEKLTSRGRKEQVWWTRALAGFRCVGESLGGIPTFAGLSDGPMYPDGLKQQLLGRVVGYAKSRLGNEIQQTAGWENEAEGNEAFDPAEYIDVLLSTGHKPAVVIHEGNRPAYYEVFPLDVLTDEEHQDVMDARLKYGAASTARERVVLECIKRGMVEARS